MLPWSVIATAGISSRSTSSNNAPTLAAPSSIGTRCAHEMYERVRHRAPLLTPPLFYQTGMIMICWAGRVRGSSAGTDSRVSPPERPQPRLTDTVQLGEHLRDWASTHSLPLVAHALDEPARDRRRRRRGAIPATMRAPATSPDRVRSLADHRGFRIVLGVAERGDRGARRPLAEHGERAPSVVITTRRALCVEHGTSSRSTKPTSGPLHATRSVRIRTARCSNSAPEPALQPHQRPPGSRPREPANRRTG